MVVKLSNDTTGITLANSDNFGWSVSLGDGALAVGAPGDDTGGSGRGAVYIIDDGDDGWGSVEAGDVLTVDNTTTGLSLDNNDALGSAVALAEGALAVGAHLDDTGGTSRGVGHLLNPLYSASLATGDFEKDGTPTDDDALGAGSVTVSVSLTDLAGNTGSGSGSFVYDPVLPTISSGSFAGSAVTVVMSEAVYGTPTAGDFKVKSGPSGSLAANTVTGIAGMASAEDSADDSFVLTVTNAIAGTDTAKVVLHERGQRRERCCRERAGDTRGGKRCQFGEQRCRVHAGGR